MGSETDDTFSNLTQMWLQTATQVMQACAPAENSSAGSTASPEMFRKGRADVMQLWSDWCEDLMRSSAFLEAQKQCREGGLALRKQFRTNLRHVQRELQLAGREDIDTVVAAIRRSQRRVLDQLEETSDRLQSLESKLDRLSERIERFMGLAGGGPGPAAGEGNAAAPATSESNTAVPAAGEGNAASSVAGESSTPNPADGVANPARRASDGGKRKRRIEVKD